MTSALDDDDLALSINPSHTRRGSARSPGEQSQNNDPMTQASAPQARQPASTHSASSHSRTSRLGQYNIIKTLGEGSFGKVKLATHSVSKQKVALKIISRRKLLARDMAGRVEREIQYLQLLRHPHIIKLYTVITTATEIIMVLEYAGSELFNYIVEHGKMIEDKARGFFQQIVCAVEYCHRHKIVHRDLKPENLLLDENMHVKIADFGLSNIMTDGNFLKTSCGSPNYAAPEVISGKLYAGPEVDVWSCGVILYVLLVGRLPFDDEYIPALFKKIAQGNYHVPQYLSQGAAKLIRKMLQVSPVHRITIQEIRQDPWFMKNLPEYLQPPVEEFLDTGVDPSKPIDPRSLGPTKPTEVIEKLHDSVVGKLGKTMGYGREDVQQALAVDEPNAIKDAYLIVRENQLMRDTPSMAKDPKMGTFLAQSPPVNEKSPIASIAEAGMQSLAQASQSPSRNQQHSSSPHNAQQIQQQQSRSQRRESAGGPSVTEVRSPAGSNIAVLPSSLPDYHRAFMAGQPKNARSPGPEGDGAQRQNDSVDQTERARRLNPHSRSQMNLERMNKPEGMTPLHPPEKKKNKPMKWQFGIRSKNHAAEAMLAIYRALKAMGADWEKPKTRKPGDTGSDGQSSPADSRSNADGISGSEEDSDFDSDDSGDDLKRNGNDSFNSSGRGRGRTRYGSWNDWGYNVPEDPWIINARFRKGDMLPPGVLHANSANSSRVDLNVDPNGGSAGGSDIAADDRRRSSAMSSAPSSTGELSTSTGGSASNPTSQGNLDSAPATTNQPTSQPPSQPTSQSTGSRPPSNAGPVATASTHASFIGSTGHSATSLISADNTGRNSRASTFADDSAYIYLTIQLYAIEKETYLVDFKCAGYERVVRRLAREIQDQSDMLAEEGEEQDEGGPIGQSQELDGKSHIDSNSDQEHHDNDDEDEDEDVEEENPLTKFESGRPRETGNWGAMKARRNNTKTNGSHDGSPSVSPGTADPAGSKTIDRTDHAPGAEDQATGTDSSAPPPQRTTGSKGSRKGDVNRQYITKEDLIPRGRAAEEKDVSSPFPFLDVASRLIIQLARAD